MKKKVQGILGNMWVCPVPFLPESGARLQLASEGVTEWKSLSRKTDARGWSQEWLGV